MANKEKTAERMYYPPIIYNVGPELMEIGEELKVRCGGEGSRSLEQKHFILKEKYRDFGLFETPKGYRKCFSWWDVSKIMDIKGMVDSDYSVSLYTCR
ncbi:MAG: hypothetical protein MJ117_00405 [Lachnospiraceae bacterium]|nr:hypothetical protein [Lachnospiraceae bacterium]